MNAPCPLCIIIPGPSFAEAQQQICRAAALADMIEFRLDLFDFDTLDQIAALKKTTSLPVLFTLRRASHGGKCHDNPYEQLRQLLTLQPEYLDLEYDLDPAFFEEVHRDFPKVRIICSAHNHNISPPNLSTLYARMQQRRAHQYKVVIHARHGVDALRMLAFVRDARQRGESLTGICLGETGQPTRILGPAFGGAITFAALDKNSVTAAGQLDAETLLTLYRYRSLNAETKLYGLIGDPVSQSKSPLIHNKQFAEHHLNALYVKLQVPADELQPFFHHAQLLGFRGFSVTMPLKEQVGDYCTDVQHSYPAINTLTLTPQSIHGFNTDGSGALAALNLPSYRDKRIVLLGAGGAAMAIADALHTQGAKLIILNRHLARAQHLSARTHAEYGRLDQFPQIAKQGYDVLINATAVGMGNATSAPIAVDQLLPERIVMDIVTEPKETLLLSAAREKRCTVVYGEQMLAAQAERQFAIWNQS